MNNLDIAYLAATANTMTASFDADGFEKCNIMDHVWEPFKNVPQGEYESTVAQLADAIKKLLDAKDSEPSLILAPVSECDIEEFKDVVYKGHSFEWEFPDENGKEITIRFTQEGDGDDD